MADLEDSKPSSGQEQQHSSGGTGGDIGLNMPYIKSIPGILKIVEFFTLLLAFSIAGNAYSYVSYYGYYHYYYSYSWGNMDFFLFATVTSWIVVLIFFVLFAFNIIAKINLNLDWNLPVLVFAVIAAILILISSSLVAHDISPASGVHHPIYDKLRAGVAFGYISMLVLIGDAVVHVLKIKGKM
ncbi:PREDICTED: uncharacterized protein LOC107357109 [Acropora digitifera]|uniref:uncharacterized protein LOC107357109 n=1 Tax=Acropora digitifera TaxID=70779 RepID=UPI00077A9333|nr:PREDICTED: uncharacterized protein LOC107357109 [Acropora digitifera]XP_015779254.1 PREDICTED: uncharacterized protein LOC107357109 [Acropora digitifera]